MTSRLGDCCGQELARLADQDDRIWALDGDLGDSDGALHFARRHSRRFVMAGIAEQTMVSLAAGMASCGKRPWVFSFAAFLCYRAYDQIRVCLSQADQPVTLVGSHSGGCTGHNGCSHSTERSVPHDIAAESESVVPRWSFGPLPGHAHDLAGGPASVPSPAAASAA
jgi:transketolase C-terminal domain/subunit